MPQRVHDLVGVNADRRVQVEHAVVRVGIQVNSPVLATSLGNAGADIYLYGKYFSVSGKEPTLNKC